MSSVGCLVVYLNRLHLHDSLKSEKNLLNGFLVFILVLCIGDMEGFATQKHKQETLDCVVWNVGGLGLCAIAASQEQPLILACRNSANTVGSGCMSNFA